MSRGLGKTQRAILEHLKKKRGRWVLCKDLVNEIYPSTGIAYISSPELSATYRAIRSLEDKGLVETKRWSYKDKRNTNISCKCVRLFPS